MPLTMEPPLAKASTCEECRLTADAFTIPLIELLNQLVDVVKRLSDAQYVQKPVGVVESSVGGHVRHCLDHVRSLLGAIETGALDYDQRARGTQVETNRCAAAEEARTLIAALRQVDADALSQIIRINVLMSADAGPLEVVSSVGREMAYTLSHTIHHNALIGAMVKTLNGWLPPRFGYAPSTIRNHSCAR